MKKAFLALSVAASFILPSCQKEDIQPNTPGNTITAKDITVEYRIYNESSDIQIEVLVPRRDGQALINTIVGVKESEYSVSFNYRSNTFLSVRAWNTNGLNKDIIVEIFVDGKLFQSATRDHATGIAAASGMFVE